MNRTQEESSLLSDLSRAIVKKIMRDLEIQLPCIVTDVSSDGQRVSVKPLIKRKIDSGEVESRAEISGITVAAFGAGGLVLVMPVKVGDKGWVEASDRDISLFLQSMDETHANTQRKLKFSDGRFIPDVFTGYSVSPEDRDAIVIQSLDGSTRLAVSDGEIKGIAPGGFFMNGAEITGDGMVKDSNGHSISGHWHEQGADNDGNLQQPTSVAVEGEDG